MISAVVNTCNEERYIRQCLEHLKWADEIIIVDMYSTDKTVEICRYYTNKIYFHERTISVLYARNFAISKANGDWILVVDPDEVIPETLAKQITELINSNPNFVAIAFPWKTIFWGKWLKYSYPVEWHTRCFKKGYVSYSPRVHSQPIIKGKVYSLPQEDKFCVIHYVLDETSGFIEKMNRYTTDEANHMHDDDGIRFRTLDLIKKPLVEFINRYFRRKGYKEGIEGFIFSVLMSIYRFITYTKLWEKNKK
jgi:glycosyltransferase involved in cell wall biosynthesis